MTTDINRTLGDLARELPAAARVLLRYRIDFCCKGNRTLAAACQQAGLDAETVAREIAEASRQPDTQPRWQDLSQAELASFIETHYHAGLRREVPSLIAAARRVEKVHAAKPAVPAGLADLLETFWLDMQAHMQKEEMVLFPMLRQGARGPAVYAPIRVMEREHDGHGATLERVRQVTGDLVAPEHACATWRALYQGLAALESDLMQHIHLENNVLFPRAVLED
ncbi:MAG TPA: iron-sulfur cluster repair di-iron protein [Kofleriaceae bacterium]|nr:iron-sulfur cluster repair di-iron protein [Kofleriaceae bacterium]